MHLNARSSVLLAFVVVFAVVSFSVAQSQHPAKPAPPAPSLIATYTASDRSLIRLVPTPNFTLRERESLHPQLSPTFSAIFTGVLRVQQPGKYTLSSAGDFKPIITLNDQDATKGLTLPIGNHALRIELKRDRAAPARFQLLWQSEHFPLEPVPSRQMGHVEPPAELAPHDQIERGRLLVEELNCIACHKSDSPSLVGRQGPDLTSIGSRVTPAWIYKWLENPQHFRRQATMPTVVAKEENRRHVAAYLSTLKDPADRPPPAEAPQPRLLQRGQFLYESTGCTHCHSEDGKGASLKGVGSKYTAERYLAAYLLDPLKFDPSGRMPSMMLEEDEASALATHLMQSKNPEYEAPVPEGDARLGQQLVRMVGCMNCHDIRSPDNQKLTPLMAMAVPPLGIVDPTRGCLSDAPLAPSPIYVLTAEDRAALRAFLDSFKAHPDVASAPTYDWPRTAAKFNCISCHNISENTPLPGLEMIPPLGGAGFKLREDFMTAVLLDKERGRPWIDRRMPHFGEIVRPVPARIAASAGVGPLPQIADPTPDLINAGRALVGGNGFGCIGCHTFNGHEVTVPPESRGPEMTRMAMRIRPDWFARWVRDPNRIQPNTAMPTFFIGKPEPEIQSQIDQLWAYISLGKQMPKPAGVAAAPQPPNPIYPQEAQ